MRQFILEQNPDKKGIIVLSGKDYRYLKQVLRVKIGDMVSVRLLDGALKNSTVAKIDENQKKVTLQLCAESSLDNAAQSLTRGVKAGEIQANIEKNVEYWLFQFIPKVQKLEQIVKQATECGVKRIIPIIGEYSDKNSISALSGSKKERIDRIIKEARQQSGSPIDTVLEEPVSLEQAVELWNAQNELQNDLQNDMQHESCKKSLGFVLSERDDCCETVQMALKKCENLKRICVVCGSEGGISPDEVDFLVKKALFIPIHFSVNILRCETAALYGIAAVQVSVSLNQ